LEKILIITVGGSFRPIISSIRDNNPDFIYFICSDDSPIVKGTWRIVSGKGKPCIPREKDKSPLPSIVEQLELMQESYEVVKTTKYDNLNEMYSLSHKIIKKCKKKYPNGEIILDYTGGTKTMSAGLVTSGLEIGNIVFCIMRGTRSDLIQVRDGTEKKWLIKNTKAMIEKQINQAMMFANKYEFQSAKNILEDLTDLYDINEEIHSKLINYLDLINAIEAWDKFDHNKALDLLKPYRRYYYKYIEYLEKIIEEKTFLGKKLKETIARKNNYILSWDIFNNAKRRAIIGCFDDAIARLYRTIELIVQTRLKEGYKINTSQVPSDIIEKCSEFFFENYYQKGKESLGDDHKLALKASFGLLGELDPEDPIFKFFKEREEKILYLLNKRNESILAHGFIPIEKIDYNEFETLLLEFLKKIIEMNDSFLKKFIENYSELTFIDMFKAFE